MHISGFVNLLHKLLRSISSRRVALKRLALAASLLCLTACNLSHLMKPGDGPPPRDINVAHIPNAVPRVEPRSKYGNPKSYVINGKRYYVRKSSIGFVQRGIASWYGTKFHGRRTSSGTPYNMYAMSAAHPTLPLPTYVQVSNLRNGRSVVVRINDRGPFHDNRVIDLSYTAAKKLDITRNGTGLVEVRALDPRNPGANVAKGRKSPHPHRIPRLFLQLGAFTNQVNAQHLLASLPRSLKTSIHIVKGSQNNRAIYRVRLGPLRSVGQTDRLTAYLRKLGVHEPHVVIE